VNTQRFIDLGAAALDFSRIERITFHQDGDRPEMDADHTVMLSWLACAFASEYYLDRLDIGLVAQFTVIHDAIEIYTGDVNTLRITPEEMHEKRVREVAAFQLLKKRFEHDPDRAGSNWFVWAVGKYEEQRYQEARFVRGMDKLMPKITHILNGGTVFRVQEVLREELVARYDRQYDEMIQYCYDFPELFEFRRELIDLVFKTCGDALR
jgi:5'-deoxynucleotidase YfbR-like HD superfamily hydrolase